MTPSPRPRRPMTVVVLVAVLALLAASCTKDKKDAVPEAKEATSSTPRAKALADDAMDGAGVARNVGAAVLEPLLRTSRDNNIVYSPTSITMALGMVRAGASGFTSQQLDALMVSLDAEKLHRSLNGLATTVEDLAGKAKDVNGDEVDIEVTASDSMWGQKGTAWKKSFLDVLHREYGAGVFEVDFKGDHDTAREQINAWVADKTDDEIVEVLPDGFIDSSTRVTFADVLFLSAGWDRPFADVGQKPFTPPSGATYDVATMRTQLTTTYRETADWQAVSVPYAGKKLAMTILLPKAGADERVLSAIDGNLMDLLSSPDPKAPRTVRLTMPAFTVDVRPDLTSALKSIGLSGAFEEATDFANMTDDPEAGIRLSSVFQQVRMTVDPTGTTAAAASGANASGTGKPSTPKDLAKVDVDRPFVFIISDTTTKAPLFVGRITAPQI